MLMVEIEVAYAHVCNKYERITLNIDVERPMIVAVDQSKSELCGIIGYIFGMFRVCECE